MNSHEIAAKLLEMPDVPVVVHASERGWPDDLEIEPDDIVLKQRPDGSEYVEVWPS